MYRYEYEPLETGGGSFVDNGDCGHRAVIARRAAEGWRYAGFVPVSFTGRGGLRLVDLVFEKEDA